MVRALQRVLWVGVALAATAAAGGPAAWQKIVAPDKAYSFHAPGGWKRLPMKGAARFVAPEGGEELLVVPLGKRAGKSPGELAGEVVALLQQRAPDVEVKRGGQVNAQVTLFALEGTEKGEPFKTAAMLIVLGKGAFWVGASAPAAAFSSPRASALAQGVVGSISFDAESKPPAVSLPPRAVEAPGAAARDGGVLRDGGVPRDGGLTQDGGMTRAGGLTRDGGMARNGGATRNDGIAQDGGA